MNPLVLILLLGAGVFAARAATTARTGNKCSIKLLNIDSFKIVGVEFEIVASIAIDNPTIGLIKLKKPYLKLLYKDDELGTSLPKNEYTTIEANKRTPLKVDLRLPFTSVPLIMGAVLKGKGQEEIITIEVSTIANGFPIKDSTDISIARLLFLRKK